MNPIILEIIKGLSDVVPVVSGLISGTRKRPFIAPEKKEEAIKVFFDASTKQIKQVLDNGNVVDVPTKEHQYTRIIAMLGGFGLLAYFVTGNSIINFEQLLQLLNIINLK